MKPSEPDTCIDYKDCFSREFKTLVPMSPDYLFEKMFCDFPGPVRWLLKLRDIMVKPFGLQGGGSFRDMITEQNDNEIVLCKNDSHLCFWVILHCSPVSNGKQTASVTTIVKFNNLLGRIYFAGIWVFHKLIVSSTFRRAVRVFTSYN